MFDVTFERLTLRKIQWIFTAEKIRNLSLSPKKRNCHYNNEPYTMLPAVLVERLLFKRPAPAVLGVSLAISLRATRCWTVSSSTCRSRFINSDRDSAPFGSWRKIPESLKIARLDWLTGGRTRLDQALGDAGLQQQHDKPHSKFQELRARLFLWRWNNLADRGRILWWPLWWCG